MRMEFISLGVIIVRESDLIIQAAACQIGTSCPNNENNE